MKIFKSHFNYSKSQRNGIFVLMLLIVLIQVAVYFYRFDTDELIIENDVTETIQQQLDSLSKVKKEYTLKPFNPNYITDYKGYQLGMSVDEIDRLLVFRKTNKYINSIADFKKVTQVSDSLLNKISPYFKFPDWVTQSNNKKNRPKAKLVKNTVVKDINKATFKALIKLKGITVKEVNTILKYRSLLQGFSYDDQLDEVWGISESLLKELKRQFKVDTKPLIKKIDINKATAYELSKLVYINYKQAKSIVNYREEVAEIQNLAELKTISNFPVDKFHLISLYLQAH